MQNINKCVYKLVHDRKFYYVLLYYLTDSEVWLHSVLKIHPESTLLLGSGLSWLFWIKGIPPTKNTYWRFDPDQNKVRIRWSFSFEQPILKIWSNPITSEHLGPAVWMGANPCSRFNMCWKSGVHILLAI